MNARIIAAGLLYFLLIACSTQHPEQPSPASRYALIPYPQQLEEHEGFFSVTPETRIIHHNTFANETELLQALLSQATGSRLPAAEIGTGSNFIEFLQDTTVQHEEGYTLTISSDKVTVKAKSGAGIFRAIETIRQLLPAETESKAEAQREIKLPATQITDYPAYQWRGMHLDVSRHFFSTEYLKKFIDLLALYKFNTLHLHLTDDQGWRIEIKKYPALTEHGAWREFNNQDSVCIKRSVENPDFVIDPKHIIQRDGKTLYGGFYTQDEMRQIIAFASARHITIIPEIDMPGHMMAAIREIPSLACNGDGAAWGKLFSTPICPCNEETYRFAEDIFTEIFALFPSPYIHLGADEVEKTSWSKSDACKALMKKQHLKDLNELQSYFVQRMKKFFQAHGKKLIGWDEILEGGVSSSAMVMYWRTWVPDAPVKAAKNGNLVIMTPGNPLYFDAQPDDQSIPNVYHFEPVPKGLDSISAKNIIGAQANTWTEYIPTETRADYMIMPRMTALSEVLWTHRQNYTNYLERLNNHYERLDRLNVNYRLPELKGFTQKNAFVDKAVLDVKPPIAGLILRYTMDGSLPDNHSTELKAPVTIDKPLTVRLAAFTQAGRRGDVYTLEYDKQTYSPGDSASTLQNGLDLSWYKGLFKLTANIKAKADTTLRVPAIIVPEKIAKGSFGLKYRGYLNVPARGIYHFYFTCDDGGVLRIANRLVVDNDGLHAPLEKSGSIALDKGAQPFELDFIEGGGGFTLNLMYSVDGSKPAPVPDSWWKVKL
ncbi:MAG TPA: family 20 glycosylhydrolase [Ohtaekwangia sp.]|uniref:family 20 glycosylhydrolase n=1 Tax=Ohtaekwangia sp. TaxID=2066019 RepID=UPI002F948E85